MNTNPSSDDSVFIYCTPSKSEIAFIKSVLEENNIPYFIDNEAAFGLAGAFIGANDMGVHVPRKHRELALELLKDFIGPSQPGDNDKTD
jgi:hypothetical protein